MATGGSSPPLYVTPPPSYVEGAWFDQAAVDWVVNCFRDLRHTKDRWFGEPMELEEWQLEYIIGPAFGWKYPNGRRIIRVVYVELPRKNGKTTLASGLMIILTGADGQMGAEVYAAAGGREQAGRALQDAKSMLRGSPLIKGPSPRFRLLAKSIEHPSTGSYFKVLSSRDDLAHGLNVSGGVIDELHIHKSPDLVEAIETGTMARSEPLIVIITTADEGDDDHSIYARRHLKTIRLAEGNGTPDPTFYGVIWAAEESDDPFDEATWRKANPGYDTIIDKIAFKQAAQNAQEDPAEFPSFCRLHLNLRYRQQAKWLQLPDWDAELAKARIDYPALIADRAQAYGGLDLSTTIDLTAFSLWLPPEDPETGVHQLVVRHFMPEDSVIERTRKDGVPYDEWVNAGWIIATEGNVVDYRAVRDVIEQARDELTLGPIGYDPYNATQLVVELQDEAGLTMHPVRQSYTGLSAASKDFERLLRSGRLRHGGNPVLRWQAAEVEVKSDDSGNIRPVKPDRRVSSKRIDGIVASVMAKDMEARFGSEPEYLAVGF